MLPDADPDTRRREREDAGRTKGGRGEIRNVKGRKRPVAPRGSSVENMKNKKNNNKNAITKTQTLRLYLAGPSALLL